MKRLLSVLLFAWLTICLVFSATGEALVDECFAMTDEIEVEWGMDYFTPGEVALYLYAFGELPPNYLTKEEARDMGWVSNKGNLWEIGEGLTIGGDVFGNREGLLPDAKGRTWYECDVNYFGGFRGSERLVFATDGLIYYTGDHYETFDMLYDGWYDENYLYGIDYDYEYDYYDDDSYEESWWSFSW